MISRSKIRSIETTKVVEMERLFGQPEKIMLDKQGGNYYDV